MEDRKQPKNEENKREIPAPMGSPGRSEQTGAATFDPMGAPRNIPKPQGPEKGAKE